MATVAVTFTPINGGTVLASELVTNFTDLVTFINASVVHVDGSNAMTGALPMGGFKITGLGTPTAATDAATMAYADTKLADHGAWTAVTYNGTWVDLGGGFAGVAYMKDDDGLVFVRGACKNGFVAADPIFTLPVGFRPSTDRWFPNPAAGATSQVTSAGVVSVPSGGATTRQDLDGIIFHV